MSHTCPVCGFPELEESPRSEESGGGSYEICLSCGFQFGVTDDDRGYSYKTWRQQWIENGMQWNKGRSTAPRGWDPVKQLRNIGIEFDDSVETGSVG